MGLDMYLKGQKYLSNRSTELEDGFEVKEKTLRLAYWRKHPNLHGFIVNTFRNGKDDCQPIDLDEKALLTIIKAVKNESLPYTEGFFFGKSDGSEKEYDLMVLTSALEWLQKDPLWHSVQYEASW